MEWEAFLPRVRVYVSACPDELAIDHIKDAARDFCTRTLAWNYETDSMPSVAGVASYLVDIDEGQEIVRVEAIDVDGEEYPVMNGPRARRLSRAGSSKRYASLNYGTQEFVLSPAPATDGLPIVMDVAVKPAMDAPDFPDELAEHVKTIADGAIATLCAMPKQTWTDGNVAGLAQVRFDDKVSEVKHEIERAYSRAARPSRTQFF